MTSRLCQKGKLFSNIVFFDLVFAVGVSKHCPSRRLEVGWIIRGRVTIRFKFQIPRLNMMSGNPMTILAHFQIIFSLILTGEAHLKANCCRFVTTGFSARACTPSPTPRLSVPPFLILAPVSDPTGPLIPGW